MMRIALCGLQHQQEEAAQTLVPELLQLPLTYGALPAAQAGGGSPDSFV